MTATPANNPIQTPTPGDQALWDCLHTAARNTQVSNAIKRLYEQLDTQVRQRGPICWSSGKCCHFDQYGHRLYVTALEVAWVLTQSEILNRDHTPPSPTANRRGIPTQMNTREVPTNAGIKQAAPRTTSDAKKKYAMRIPLDQITQQRSCPFQIDRLCSIHTIRPMGCRVFFCQQGTQPWQKDLYETFLNKLRRLHDDFSLPYRYMEWRAGLHDAIHHHPQHPTD